MVTIEDVRSLALQLPRTTEALVHKRVAPRGGRTALACLRITIAERPGRKPSGSFRVLGGTGDASRLSATGTFTFTPGPVAPSTLTGTVKARLSGSRGLPRTCTALG